MEKSKKNTRKKIMATILVAGCMMYAMTVACNKLSKDDNNTKANAATEKYNEGEIATPSSNDNMIYMNNYELGVSFSLPSSWDGLYTCENANGCIRFYHTSIHAKNGKGLLFTLYTDTTSVLQTENNPYSSLENFKILDTDGDNNVFISYPSTADSVVKDFIQEYNTMLNEVEKTISPSVHFTK